jgi:hypothetical protein
LLTCNFAVSVGLLVAPRFLAPCLALAFTAAAAATPASDGAAPPASACVGDKLDLDAILAEVRCAVRADAPRPRDPLPGQLRIRLEPAPVKVPRGRSVDVSIVFENRTRNALPFAWTGLGGVQIFDQRGKRVDERSRGGCNVSDPGLSPVRLVALASRGQATAHVEVSATTTIIDCEGESDEPLPKGTYKLRVDTPLGVVESVLVVWADKDTEKGTLEGQCIHVTHVGSEDAPVGRLRLCIGAQGRSREDSVLLNEWTFYFDQATFRRLATFISSPAWQGPIDVGTDGSLAVGWRATEGQRKYVLPTRKKCAFLEGLVQTAIGDAYTEVREVGTGMLAREGCSRQP